MKRFEYIDLTKGLAILLVIISHTLPFANGGARDLIFSFHMPLFFILSGYTSKNSSDFMEVKARTIKLIKKFVPVVLGVWTACLCFDLFFRFEKYASYSEFIYQKFFQLAYCSGVINSNLTILGGVISSQ